MASASRIGPGEMAPALPPEPSPRKLPFQLEAGGSQTSKPIWESLVGVIDADHPAEGLRNLRRADSAAIGQPGGALDFGAANVPARQARCSLRHRRLSRVWRPGCWQQARAAGLPPTRKP